MRRVFLLLFIGILIIVAYGYSASRLYFPGDIVTLSPLFHENFSSIPRNSLISDPLTQFEPWRHFAKQQLLEGNFPLWNELNGKGVPFFANGQSAILFPLNFFYYIFPISLSLNLITLLKIFFLFLFSYIYLKSIKCSDEASLIGSFVVTFSGFPFVWYLWPHTNVYLFFPLLLFITEKLRVEKESLVHRWYALMALSYCLAVLGGHPETLVHIFLIHWVYILFRIGFFIKKLLTIAIFMGVGFFLAAIQLLPLIEYLLNSYAFIERMPDPYLHLQPVSFLLNFIPFILGSPHLPFYRSISNFTNFQESIGGYTGQIVLLTALLGAFVLLRKEKLIQFWFFLSIVVALVAYKIWPFGLFLELPLLNQAQNGRLSAFIVFGISVLFAFTINYKDALFKKYKRFIESLTIGLLSFSLFTVIIFYVSNWFIFHPLLTHPFISFLKLHILFILFTTSLFFTGFYLLSKFKVKKGVIICILFFVGLQTVGILGNYVPLIHLSQYYPESPLVKKIKSLPSGAILEVGNPSLSPDINLMYGIPLVENYDALEIRGYKEAFDNAFPIKNHWGKVDFIDDIEKLKRFGISYILIDHNPNVSLHTIQPLSDTLVGPLISSVPFKISFTANADRLSAIRVLPANYNRKNDCTVVFSIVDQETTETILSRNVACNSLLNKIYFTLELGNISIEPGKKYIVTITSLDGTSGNAVGFWGNREKVPYLAVLSSSSKNIYEFMGKHNGVQLWKVPEVSEVVLPGKFTILHKTHSELLIEYNAVKAGHAEIKIPFYPGWHASIDGFPAEIKNGNPFIHIKIPEGRHVLRVSYLPLSFIAGAMVSFVSSIFLIIFLVRKERQRQWMKRLFQQWNKWIEKQQKISWVHHLGVVLIGIVIATSLYLSVIFFISPTFTMPWTTAINWYTVHGYPRQQDYFYFLTAFGTISCITIFIWFLYIWLREK